MTLQYHIGEYFWPEFAFNDTQWTSGVRAGRNQLLVGPGIMFGRFNLYNDLVKFNFDIAYQVAVVPDHHITESWVDPQRALDFLRQAKRWSITEDCAPEERQRKS